MNRNLKLNRAACKKLIRFQIYYVLFINMFISWLGFPSILTYVTDIVNILLLVMLITVKARPFKSSDATIVFTFLALFIGAAAIGDVLNFVNPLLIIWAGRNVFRGIVFWMACVEFFDVNDIRKLFGSLLKIQWINIAITIIQYAQGYNQDNLGGIFGVANGCNGYTNIFFVALMTYYIVSYLNKIEPIRKLIFVALSTMIISALAELKVYYAEFVVIIFIAIIISKPSRKKFWIGGIGVVVVIIGLNLMQRLFPLQYSYMMSFDRIMTYNSLRSGGYNISRFGAFEQINELFFRNNTMDLLFGYGFGNCEMSSFDFFTSNFFRNYGFYNYRWFAHMMFFLEDGYVGVISFVGIFVAMLISATTQRMKKVEDIEFNNIQTFTQIMALMTIINLWYNQAIRTEAQYLIYPLLAAGFVYSRIRKKEKMSM